MSGPRGVYIALSEQQLSDAGITDKVDDNALAEMVDNVVKENTSDLAIELQQWEEDREIDAHNERVARR